MSRRNRNSEKIQQMTTALLDTEFHDYGDQAHDEQPELQKEKFRLILQRVIQEDLPQAEAEHAAAKGKDKRELEKEIHVMKPCKEVLETLEALEKNGDLNINPRVMKEAYAYATFYQERERKKGELAQKELATITHLSEEELEGADEAKGSTGASIGIRMEIATRDLHTSEQQQDSWRDVKNSLNNLCHELHIIPPGLQRKR